MSITRDAPRAFIFAITADGVTHYWTGTLDHDGRLARSAYRADAYKFSSSVAALQCAETHEELRDSQQWKLVPLTAFPIRNPEIVR